MYGIFFIGVFPLEAMNTYTKKLFAVKKAAIGGQHNLFQKISVKVDLSKSLSGRKLSVHS